MGSPSCRTLVPSEMEVPEASRRQRSSHWTDVVKVAFVAPVLDLTKLKNRLGLFTLTTTHGHKHPDRRTMLSPPVCEADATHRSFGVY